MFRRLQDMLPRAANRMGIGKEFHSIKVCKAAESIMAEHLKGFGDGNVRAKSYQKGQLVIEVKNGAWGQEVIMRKEKIINELNKKMGRNVIKNLQTRLKY